MPQFARLNLLSFLSVGQKILWTEFEDRPAVCTPWLERKFAAFDTVKSNEGGCGTIVEVVLRVVPLFTNFT